MWIFIITLAFITGSFITMYVIDKTVVQNIKKQIERPRNNILKMEQSKKFQLDDYTRNEVIPSILELFEGLKEGKEIQEYVYGRWIDSAIPNDILNMLVNHYRIKPENIEPSGLKY